MFIDFLLLGIVFAFIIPTISGYYAYMHGRSFWLWFLIGTFLPILSYFILILLPNKKDSFDDDLHDLRVQLGLLGVKQDAPFNDFALKRLLKKTRNRLSFSIVSQPNSTEKFLEILIDNKSLLSWIIVDELLLPEEERLGKHNGLPLETIKYPFEHFLGTPYPNHADERNRTVLLSFKKSSEKQSWKLVARIQVLPSYIVWRDFYHVTSDKKIKYTNLKGFVFNKFQYMEALHEIAKQVA